MAETEEYSAYSTRLSFNQIRSVLGDVLSSCTVEPLEYGPLDDVPDLGISATKLGLLGGSSAIQVLVHKGQERNGVEIIAYWDSFMSRAFQGSVSTISQSGSKKLATSVYEAFREADPTFALLKD